MVEAPHWVPITLDIAHSTVQFMLTYVHYSNGVIVHSAVRVGTAATPGNIANAIAVDTLASAMDLAVSIDGGDALKFVSTGFHRGGATNMSMSWTATASASAAASGDNNTKPTSNRAASAAVTSITVDGALDCTGYIDYTVTITPPAGAKALSVDLNVPSAPSNALMAMGLGMSGGYIDEMPPPPQPFPPVWLVLDMGASIEADNFRVWTSGWTATQVPLVFTRFEETCSMWTPHHRSCLCLVPAMYDIC